MSTLTCSRVCTLNWQRQAAENSFSNILPCPVLNGTFTHTFCFSAEAGSKASKEGCCDGIKFGGGGFGNFQTGAGILGSSQTSPSKTTTGSPTVSVTSRPSGSSTSPQPSASQQTIFSTILLTSRPSISSTPPQPSASQHPSSTKTITIGAGVGVPLGVLLVAGFSYLWYRERMTRRQLEERLSNMQSSRAPLNGTTGYNLGSQIQELHDLQRPLELHSQPLVEVAHNLWIWNLVIQMVRCWHIISQVSLPESDEKASLDPRCSF